jgi:hypothetical protein
MILNRGDFSIAENMYCVIKKLPRVMPDILRRAYLLISSASGYMPCRR